MFLYIIFLILINNDNINYSHWTVFTFSYIFFFAKIPFVATMWNMILWHSMAISDLLLWAGYWNIALLKTKGNVLTELRECEFLRNVRFMQLVISNTVSTRKRYVVKHNLITEVYLITVMETTTCFSLYWPSSGCLGNLRASYMHARARGVEISTYA